MQSLRISIKFFTFGLLAGLLFAPRPGKETRRQIIDHASTRVQEALGAAE